MKSRYDEFRDALGNSVSLKMKAEGWTMRKLAYHLNMAPSAIHQISAGCAGSHRNVPNLEKHFKILEWLDMPLGNLEPDREREGNLNDVADAIMRLPISPYQKNLISDLIATVWENTAGAHGRENG